MGPHTNEPPADRIAAAIVQRISTGKLQPGDRILEQALADEFGTSRGPVRDALKTLAVKGWIELARRQGARVATQEETPSVEAVLIAAVMMGLACRFAVTKATDADVDEFYHRVREVVRIGDDPASTPEVFNTAARRAGHLAISLAGNRFIQEVIGSVPRGALTNYGPLGTLTYEARVEATGLWSELGVAFKMRDPLRAERVARSIIESSFERVLQVQLHTNGKSD